MTAITNRVVYNTSERKVPTGGTDYFVRIREGESNIEWVQLVGTLTVTNKVAGSNEVVRLLTPNGTVPRMTLVGDHLWRYHYAIPTNGVGATLKFRIVAKEHYTNETDSATWHVCTNVLSATDEKITSLPYTATLSTNNTHEMTVVLDDSSTHLKIEYNDEQQAFAFSHASYQDFGKWTDAMKGFAGDKMLTSGVSNSGVANSKRRYDAPFGNTWALPSSSTLWSEDFTDPYTNDVVYVLDKWFSVGQTPNGWTAHNGRYVPGVRGNRANMAFAMDGLGEGALATENFAETELPLGLESVSFTARIAQPIDFDDFATYMDGLSCKNYAISAKVTMSQDYEATGHLPKDISPVSPSISLVGYYRQKQGCYEFRMTRAANDVVTLALYKWTKSGSSTKSTLLTSATYTKNILMPQSSTEQSQYKWTAAYLLVYTIDANTVRVEGHVSPSRTQNQIVDDISGMRASLVSYVDTNPGKLAQGGSYGVGSTDCRAGFGYITLHTDIPTPPLVNSDAIINAGGTLVTKGELINEWDYYDSRWEVANTTIYAANGCLMAVEPTNQTVQVWLSDAEAAAASSGWKYSGYERIINSFTTNRFTVSPKMSGTWKVRLQTSEEERTGVVLDDVQLTAWESENVWGRKDDADTDFDDEWAYTKGWITARTPTAANPATRECLLQPSRGKVGYPMGIRSPYIDEGLSLFSYTYKNADSNCVMLVQIATNMAPREGTSDVADLTVLTESDVDDGYIWTTVATNDFRKMTSAERANGTHTTFISLRQHNIYDIYTRTTILTNVCGLIRVIVDPAIVKRAVEASPAEREALLDYGKITITEAHCYNEPMIDLKSWFGWNVYTAGWDGGGNAERFAYLTDYPDGLSIALNFSAKEVDNDVTKPFTLGIGLSEPDKAVEYAGQNPFVQCAALTNGIGTVSFRARLFDTNAPRAVVTLYGGTDPGSDQPTTDSATWDILTNFVVTSSTYQPFEWALKNTDSPYKAVRLSAAGARWGRYPSAQAKAWEWGDLDVKQEPVNRVFIDEMSASELIVPRLKFLDVRPFRSNLGTEEICVIENIRSEDQQPLIAESWGLQCRVEPQQMADELNRDSIKVYMEVFRGKKPWGYEQWKDMPEYDAKGKKQRFRKIPLTRVGDTLVYRSYYTVPDSIMQPEETANTVYQFIVHAEYSDNSGDGSVLTAALTSTDWAEPEWYRGSTVGAANKSGDPQQFSGYTILDAISPRRAWVNEVNYVDGDDTCLTNQFMELAVPQAANLEGWKLVVTTRDQQEVTLVTLGYDDGVQDIVSKQGTRLGEDFTNHYTFVSVCAPSSLRHGPYDGCWNAITKSGLTEGRLQYYAPYGIQLIRPSNIIEHEFVVEGTNTMADMPAHAWKYSGTNLVATLRARDGEGSQWFYAGEDLADVNTSLGVWRSHGEEAIPSNWTNYMWCTPGVLNRLKDGTRQEIPANYFLEPNGTNVWIYSYLADDYVKQYFGGRDMGASAVIVLPKDTETNLVLSVTNWYQVGECTTNGVQVEGMRGQTGDRIVLNLGKVQETMSLLIGSEPQEALASRWGLTGDNRYTTAVIAWLLDNYSGYSPEDLSPAEFHALSGFASSPLSLTEMYWLNIPPVHKAPVLGGSNIWFVAGMGTPNPSSGPHPPAVEPHVTVQPDGTLFSNVYVTVTMMITNTATGDAVPPDRLNGLVYDGQGSSSYIGRGAWTSVVFSVTGALQKPGYTDTYRPLQQYVFKPGSFGAAGDPHPFQTRIEVMDPYNSNTMGYYYGWTGYRDVFPIWYRWTIDDNADGRVSPVPLVPDWTSVSAP